MSHWVEFDGIGVATQSGCLQWNGSAPGEHVKHSRTRDMAALDVRDFDFASRIARQSFCVAFENLLCRFFDDRRQPRILAQYLDKFLRSLASLFSIWRAGVCPKLRR